MRRRESGAAASYGKGASTVAGSAGSRPRIALNTIAQSSTLRHSGPGLSIDQTSAITPARLTRPKLGRSPVTPVRVDGETIDPRVSVPSANGTRPADTAAAGPAEEPLEPSARFHGLCVVPRNHWSPHASAPVDSLATRTAPASSSLRTEVAVSLST